MLTKSVAFRYDADNIRCNCIYPSTVNTPMFEKGLKGSEFAAERF